jgi:hypothetical protein
MTVNPKRLLPPLLTALAALAWAPAPALSQAPPAPLQGIDAFVEAGMESWGIPGWDSPW